MLWNTSWDQSSLCMSILQIYRARLSSLSFYPSPSLSLSVSTSLWPCSTFKTPQKQPQPKQCELCSKHTNNWDQILPLAHIHTDNHLGIAHTGRKQIHLIKNCNCPSSIPVCSTTLLYQHRSARQTNKQTNGGCPFFWLWHTSVSDYAKENWSERTDITI